MISPCSQFWALIEKNRWMARNYSNKPQFVTKRKRAIVVLVLNHIKRYWEQTTSFQARRICKRERKNWCEQAQGWTWNTVWHLWSMEDRTWGKKHRNGLCCLWPNPKENSESTEHWRKESVLGYTLYDTWPHFRAVSHGCTNSFFGLQGAWGQRLQPNTKYGYGSWERKRRCCY